MVKRLERIEGTSRKFWEIEVLDSSHRVRFGRIGGEGQTRTKDFASARAAALDAAGLIEEKLGKGYREAGAPEAESRSNQVTRFTLVREGLPESPFILLQAGRRMVCDSVPQTFRSVAAANEHRERVISLRQKEGYVLQPTDEVSEEELEQAATSDNIQVEQKDARVTVTFREEVTLAECSQVVRRLERWAPRFLQLICDPASPGSRWEKAVVGHRLASVTAFVFDTHFETRARQGQNAPGDLAVTLASLPSVERVFATGKVSLRPCRHGQLRALHLMGDPLPASSLKGLSGSEFPLLERLVVSLASDARPAPSRGVTAALVGMQAERLREVHLDGLDDVAAILDGFGRSSFPLAWQVLVLRGAVDEARLLSALRDHSASLARLKSLALPGAGSLSTEGWQTACRLLPNLRDAAEGEDLTLPDVYQQWP